MDKKVEVTGTAGGRTVEITSRGHAGHPPGSPPQYTAEAQVQGLGTFKTSLHKKRGDAVKQALIIFGLTLALGLVICLLASLVLL